MASDKARKYVEDMLANPRPRASISSGVGNRGMPAPGALEFRPTAEPPAEKSLLRQGLEIGAPALAATALGGPFGAGAVRMLGMGGRAIPAARLAGETLAAAGLGATGMGTGQAGMEGAAEAGLGNLLGAGLGRAGLGLAREIPGVNRLLTPIPKSQLAAGAREADLMLRSREEGLLLSQAFDSPLIQNAERIFDQSMVTGRGALGRAAHRADQAARDMAEEYISGIVNTGGRQEVGEAIEGFLTKKYDVFRAASSANYAKVDQLAKGVTVDIGPLQQEAARLMQNGEIVGGGASTILKNVIGRERYIPFSEAAKLRSSLLAVGREGETILPDQAAAFSKKLAPVTERQMDLAANAFDPATGASASPGAWQAYQAARAFHRQGVEPFNNEGIRAVMRRQPEAVAQYLVPLSGNFKVSAIQALKRISGNDPTGMDALRGHYVSELLRSAAGEPTDVLARSTNAASTRYVSGSKLLSGLKGDRAGLEELLGKQGYQRLLSLAGAMYHAEKAPGAKGKATLGTALVYARIAPLAGGALSFQFGGPEIGTGTMATILVAPNAINHMLASPTVRRWLIGGNAPPPGSKTFSRALGQIMSHALAGQRRYGKDAITIQPGETPYRPPEGPMTFSPNDLSALTGGR